jgi:preprotein translocase subunit SecY
MTNIRGFWYNLFDFLLIVSFHILLTALIVNPTQIGDEMKKNGGFIPGVKPGTQTAEFIDSVIFSYHTAGSIVPRCSSDNAFYRDAV